MIWWIEIEDVFFIWDHGEVSFKVFITQVNRFHLTIKFTAEYLKQEVNFLDVNIKLIDLFLKHTVTNHFLDPASSHHYHYKKGILYSQAIRLDRIISDQKTLTDAVMI